MNEILVSYIEDLRDILLLFNESLMKIQNGERTKEIIDNVFRVAHTIKGNSAAMNFTKIQKVMHNMEDLLSDVRSGTKELTDDITDVLFACHDFLEDCLEIVQQHESDESIDNEKLLSRLQTLKNGAPTPAPEAVKQAPAAAPVNSDSDSASLGIYMPDKDHTPADIDLGVNMPPELWEVLNSNVKNGYSAYKLDIYFMKNSSMKAVRAWMLFDVIDQYGILLHSRPERLQDNSFAEKGETPFDSDVIETVIISDREVSDLIAELKATPDIENVSARLLPKENIEKKLNYIRVQANIASKIQEISIDLLGVDIQFHFIQPDVIETILGKLKEVISYGILDDGSPIIITAKRLALALNEALANKKRIPISERENIIFICQTIEECIISPESLQNQTLLSLLYQRLDSFIETVSTPEQRTGEILIAQSLIKETDAQYISEKQKENADLKFGQIAVKEGLVSAMDVVTALSDAKRADHDKTVKGTPTPAAKSESSQESGFVKVPVTKVDSLIDTLSELLIYNSQLDQSISMLELDDPKTANILSRTEKLIKELQDLSMSLRMIEVKPTFNRLTRIVRDAATDLGKKVSIKLEGEDIEIDRSAVEKLFEPLMHMVRNAVSHGIEDTEADRIAVGKKPEGQVTIAGYSKQGNVYIEVRDDGRGINTKKVYEKAKKLGLINESREYSDEEIYKFIFLPGFSTQENVNAVAGRGVGMNVVEEVVTKLGGKVEIESVLGEGSIFRIKLPVNLAVINGTVVEIAGNRYIIPTVCVKKFFIANDSNWVSMQGKNKAIKVDGNIIPLISKEQIFGSSFSDEFTAKTENDASAQGKIKEYEMVVLETDQKSLVLHVDKIINRQDVVSKPLSHDYASVAYANSASILGDGIVSMILDIDAIFKMSLN